MARVKKIYDNKVYATPPGTASWPKVNELDTKFDVDGAWSIDINYDAKDEYFLKLQAQCIAHNKSQPDWSDGCKENYPWSPAKDADKNVIPGKFKVAFKRKGKKVMNGVKVDNSKPVIKDSNGDPWPTCQVGGGSTVQVGFSMTPYTGFGAVGVSLRLEGVRVLELVAGAGDDVDYGDFKGSATREPEQEQGGASNAHLSNDEEDDDF